jgi:hypothetical protein
LRAFLLRDFVKSVIGNAHSSFDMGNVLDGGVLLCRLPKGILGVETARIEVLGRTGPGGLPDAAPGA